MMKGLVISQEQQQHQVVEENMSNLTSASGDQTSVSSGSNINGGMIYPHHYFAPPTQTQPQPKKKRNLPGNPDPDAEVIALSPKTLMATNRFVCEICNKGFQRDQNLQLHRRGHNLPWKLKQRSSKDVIRKKVYVCPEVGCVHHDASRALGDLTGIKKHFSRKHGEKKWKCDKCTKRYAVQSDWKAHSKTCGTREYRCDCGTLFSRRDSFVTHRAFCDALAEESAKSITIGNGFDLSPQGTTSAAGSTTSAALPPHMINQPQVQPQLFNDLHAFSLKKEPQNFTTTSQIPPWLTAGGQQGPRAPMDHHLSSYHNQEFTVQALDNSNPNPSFGLRTPHQLPAAYMSQNSSSPHMSATALLQKAAQMGASISTKTSSSSVPAMTMVRGPHQQAHVFANYSNNTSGFGLNLSSREHEMMHASGFLASFGDKAAAAAAASDFTGQQHLSPAATAGAPSPSHPHDPQPNSFLDQDMMMMGGSDHRSRSTFEDQYAFTAGGSGNGNGNGSDSMTRDFLGIRHDHLSHTDILNIAGVSSDDQNNNKSAWPGN